MSCLARFRYVLLFLGAILLGSVSIPALAKDGERPIFLAPGGYILQSKTSSARYDAYISKNGQILKLKRLKRKEPERKPGHSGAWEAIPGHSRSVKSVPLSSMPAKDPLAPVKKSAPVKHETRLGSYGSASGTRERRARAD